jgi:peptidyl-tRNA hydrolase
MSPGYQGVQSIHAAVQFAFEHPDINKEWFENSNYLGFLSVQNERELNSLIEEAGKKNIKHSIFREPDVDNQITAIALAPGSDTRRLCSRLPLALRGS